MNKDTNKATELEIGHPVVGARQARPGAISCQASTHASKRLVGDNTAPPISPLPSSGQILEKQVSNRQSELIEIVISARKQRPGAISNRQFFSGVPTRQLASCLARFVPAIAALVGITVAPAVARP